MSYLPVSAISIPIAPAPTIITPSHFWAFTTELVTATSVKFLITVSHGGRYLDDKKKKLKFTDRVMQQLIASLQIGRILEETGGR